MLKNKRGYLGLQIIPVIFLAFIFIIMIGVSVYVFDIADGAFGEIDFELGNVSYAETYNTSLGVGINTMQTTAPKIMSSGVLLGMILVMILIGYLSPKIGKLWIIFDLGVIIVAEVLAVIIRDSFYSFINSSPEMLSIYSTTLSAGSTYILTLPITIPVIGGIVMFVTYVLNRHSNKNVEVAF